MPVDHASRPHLHLSGEHDDGHYHASLGHHHDEGDGPSGGPLVVPQEDHDADALYLTELTSDGRRALTKFESGVADLPAREVAAVCQIQLPQHAKLLRAEHPPDRDAPLPLYLRHASLRI